MGDPRDARHAAAVATARRLAAERLPLITTNFVVAETHGLILARVGRDDAFQWLQRLDSGAILTIRVEEIDERRARDIIARYADKDFSLTDAASFAVMERLGLVLAFTFDRHFAQFGFSPVA